MQNSEQKHPEIHIIYLHKGRVKQALKRWSFEFAETVLTRLGAEYWEIGF